MSQAELDRIVSVGRNYSNQLPVTSFFSWGGENHLGLTLGGRNEALFHQRYNQAVRGGANAGPGLYIASNLWDSSEYCPTNDGILLQIDMPTDIPYIKITDNHTMNALRQGDPAINAPMLYRQHPNIPPVLIQFTPTWYCLKTTRGVGFRIFDGRGFTTPALQQGLDQLLQQNRVAAARVLCNQLREDRRAQLVGVPV